MHTCYVLADLVTERTPAEWGAAAASAAEEAGGLAALAGVNDAAAPDLVEQVARKLREEPVEDLRLDLEDGYGERPDAEEDTDAVRAAHTVAAFARNRASGAAPAPAFAGIRFKCFEAATRARGLRTLARPLPPPGGGAGPARAARAGGPKSGYSVSCPGKPRKVASLGFRARLSWK